MNDIKVGPDRELFLALYKLSNGDRHVFNQELTQLGEEPLSITTFYRRRNMWVTGVHSDNEHGGDIQEYSDDHGDERPIAGGTIDPPDRRRGVLKGKRFVFTAAQNNTYVHEEFWRNLQAFCSHREAELVIGKFRYNKRGFQNYSKAVDDDLWYDPKVVPFIKDQSLTLGDSMNGIVWCGELDILPTAINPLSGLDSYTRTASSIVPHAKVQLQSVPVMKGDPVKMLYTTGSVTQRNYIQRKAGQKAEFHHVFGALYVEIDNDGNAFCRQLIADSSGAFYDLDEHFSGGTVSDGHLVEAIHWGDIHAELVDTEVAENGWSGRYDSMLETLQPAYQFVHDLTDFRARNHHNIKDPHFLAERYFAKDTSVEEGMYQAFKVLTQMQRDWCTTVVVESNHDQAFRRWLREADVRQDPANAEYYHKANTEVYRRIRLNQPKFHIFEWAVRGCGELNNVVFLNEDDSYIICGQNGIECGMHGHRGPNGARGNPKSLRKLGRKCNIGHAHSAAIIDGIYVAGISCSMDMGYNKGPSSWSHSHIVTYPNGKRTIITMINGKWRA